MEIMIEVSFYINVGGVGEGGSWRVREIVVR